ncbi:uncharacterized protein LY79DRAFT_247689 [Colletotrichum navitas]|uniref:Uncharacterized protein n=1 Tax=Colletotrichum navitas TaxID=681940 RepID=A0AAD8QA63_9PEZI|nr:uncharacterized protein LY79DRAFT_247689 [Colletotrichum navitas]KAK1598555.1 hypothetical protein LY79DRAFT_247689 [Colletotrichum navitas]
MRKGLSARHFSIADEVRIVKEGAPPRKGLVSVFHNPRMRICWKAEHVDTAVSLDSSRRVVLPVPARPAAQHMKLPARFLDSSSTTHTSIQHLSPLRLAPKMPTPLSSPREVGSGRGGVTSRGDRHLIFFAQPQVDFAPFLACCSVPNPLEARLPMHRCRAPLH